MSLTEESGPSHDIRIPNDLVPFFFIGALISLFLKAEFKNPELLADNVSDKVEEEVNEEEPGG